jgi:Domain of unknown function (DUF4397)
MYDQWEGLTMKRQILGVMLLAIVVLLSGIATTYADGITVVPDMGQMRVIHASPGTPNLDIYLDGASTPAIWNLAYGTSTGFMPLVSDTHRITIRVAGSPADSTPIFQRSFILSPNSSLNIVAIGLLTRQNSRGFLLLLIPANLSPSMLHYARAQVIHASPSYGTVNVYVNDTWAVQDLFYGDGLFTGIDYIPGAYTFTIKPSKNDTTITVLSLPNMVLQANTLYTIVDYGLADGIHSLVLVNPLKAPIPQVQ